MTNPTITIHNLETGEIVTRDLNAEELAEYEQTKFDSAARAAEIQAQADSKTAILERLGLTAQEANLLLS
jgi:hypothetical protein